ncbi:hypothetical protein HHTV1_12 [Haloarcula hispanica tailed virus 1]|uniref:Uncharacterized protein n=1 Tax=Haloarcula hispanica tailed virus 1 TaxID=1273750 RepID=R4TM75_9CAUD|nr:hypothetical protein M198_gp12 [Haloarcula hispanica tailed virus 1]AGM11268.1 hypothetical protein HHTV1_12 [Haloarcula hispanica tailed virus 1]
MDLPDSVRSLLGSSSEPDAGSDIEERAAQVDGGQQIVAEGEEQIAIEVPDGSDVDTEQIEAALSGAAGSVGVKGAAGGETTVTPVASGSDIHITDSAFDLSDWEYKAFLDDQITNLIDNRVDYNTETGKWILANDDLIPGILIRLKSLMLGQDGLEPKPSDPDSEQDQRLAEHLEKIYEGDQSVEAHVDPGKVVDRILEQNVINAVFVGRSTDLQHLDVDDLSYVKDGETGEEIYIQHQTSYVTFDLDEDDRDPEVNVEHTDDQKALEIGSEVLDVRLYRTPPLQSVADDVVNKMQLKRLQGRKAEIASIGGIIIKVNPPAWLSEEDYDQYVAAEDDEFGDESGRLLELVMAQQIDAALATLEDYQTATVMSIPENWETTTIELPEMDESMSSMIRDYNEAISRRLLLPLDLIELKEGPELSRNSMMQMFLDQISGWQGQVTDLFDDFAQVQADIHGLSGEVNHQLPAIAAEDEQEILKLFNFAGLLGMSEAEGRELANTLEGVDLETDPTRDMPPEGGPEDPEDREQQMQDVLDQQQPDQGPEGQNQGPAPGDEGDEPQGEGPEDGMQARFAAALSDEGAIQAGQDGDPICWVCGDEASLVNETPPHEFACNYHGISPNHVQIGQADIEAADAVPEEGEEIELPTDCRMCDETTRIQGSFYCPGCHPDIEEDQFDGELAAAESFSEGQEVETPDGVGVVVEVRTEDFEGPGGDTVEASEDQPAYVVGVESGAEVYRASDLSDGEIDAPVDDPAEDLSEEVEGFSSDIEAAGWMEVHAGPTDWDYPDSWEESDTPARLILLKAWAGMNGQFNCPSGNCCKGTMRKTGMSENASDQFCAAMKDRVLMWEGWRKGAASASVKASHGFSGYETLREAAAHVRDLIEKKTPEGHTTEMRKRKDIGEDAFAVIIRDRQGNFTGSMVVKESDTDAGSWLVIGGDDFLGGA